MIYEPAGEKAMQTVTFKNPDDTRRGVAIGKLALFLIRDTSKKKRAERPELKQFWKQRCPSAAIALKLAESWAMKGIRPV